MVYDEDSIRSLSAAELATLIEENDKLYWELGESRISDKEYDLLIRGLSKLAPAHPLLSKVSAPSVAASGKVRHKEPNVIGVRRITSEMERGIFNRGCPKAVIPAVKYICSALFRISA